MPRTKKPAGTTVDRRNGRRADLVAVAGARLDPPDGLSDEALTQWDAYWDDTVASVVTPVDRAVLRRWITEYDRYLRTVAEADKEPLVTGYNGQPAENPLYKIAYKALDAAERCERQLGVGALHRSNLGIAVIAERKSLADMNARYGGADAGDRAEAAPRPDPRVVDA
jgi:P27 family predicted phage terminase small subunit